jgi:hypothetical protein
MVMRGMAAPFRDALGAWGKEKAPVDQTGARVS